MKRDRIIKIIFSVILATILIYIRFHSEYFKGLSNHRTINTMISLLIVLISFRTLIEIVIVIYNLDNESKNLRLKHNLIVGLTNLFTIVSVISVLLGILAILGLDIKEVFTTLSIVAAAIALITKDFIVEMIIGIINGFSSKIEIEDYVEFNGQRGKIVDIGLQKITLLTEDDDVLFVPNSKFYSAEVINYTKRDIRKMSVPFELNPRYVDNVEDLEKRLTKACMSMKDYILTETCQLKIANIEQESINFKFQYTMNEVKREVHRQVRKIVLKTVANYINEKNVALEKKNFY